MLWCGHRAVRRRLHLLWKEGILMLGVLDVLVYSSFPLLSFPSHLLPCPRSCRRVLVLVGATTFCVVKNTTALRRPLRLGVKGGVPVVMYRSLHLRVSTTLPTCLASRTKHS